MTVQQANELKWKRYEQAERKAKRQREAARKAAKKAKGTRGRTTAAPPDPDPAPPAPVEPGPQSGLHLVPNSTGDQRQYLGRVGGDDNGTTPDGQRAPHPLQWSIYGSAVKSMLDAVEQGRVPTAEELAQLRAALAKVEALAAT